MRSLYFSVVLSKVTPVIPITLIASTAAVLWGGMQGGAAVLGTTTRRKFRDSGQYGRSQKLLGSIVEYIMSQGSFKSGLV